MLGVRGPSYISTLWKILLSPCHLAASLENDGSRECDTGVEGPSLIIRLAGRARQSGFKGFLTLRTP